MKRKALIALDIGPGQLELFREAAGGAFELSVKSPSGVTPADVRDAAAVVGNVAPEILRQAGRLELLQLNTAGYDNYLAPGVLGPGVRLCSAVGAYGPAVSEHMLALTFALIRHLGLYRDKQLRRDWSDCGPVISIEGSVVAVFGVGDIGGNYARKVRALGARKVVGVRRAAGTPVEGVDELVGFDRAEEAFAQADIAALALPDSALTRGLVSRRTLALMRRGAYLINVGRGSAVDQDALLESVREGRLAGAALDVCTPEPLPPASPLWAEPRILITPHVAGHFFLRETFERMIRIAAANLKAFAEGGPLSNLVAR